MAEHAYYNSKILEWARVRLGFSLEEAAISLGLSSSARLEKAESESYSGHRTSESKL